MEHRILLYMLTVYCLEIQRIMVSTVNLKDENRCCLYWICRVTDRKAGCCRREQENKCDISLTSSSAMLANVFLKWVQRSITRLEVTSFAIFHHWWGPERTPLVVPHQIRTHLQMLSVNQTAARGFHRGKKNNLTSLWNECPAGLLNVGTIRD